MLVAPIHLTFALAYHSSRRPKEELGAEHFDSPAGRDVREWMLEAGLIDRQDEFGAATAKLHAWIDHLCRQPLPECRWIVPTGHEGDPR